MKIHFKPKTSLMLSLVAFAAFSGGKAWAQTIEEVIVISSKQAAGISTQELAGFQNRFVRAIRRLAAPTAGVRYLAHDKLRNRRRFVHSACRTDQFLRCSVF